MIIKEITLNNFRIYKGVNKIELAPDGERNIIIISGDNGYGKTTFLMSLVWCLYGRQMGKVDELYRKEIEEKGGYSKYISNSLNQQAKADGKTNFSVSITFTDVEIPDIPCTEIMITRSYDNAGSIAEELKIEIDGKEMELFTGAEDDKIKEEEIFIRDYILPIEIAKFFFFDAEKIVSFAQINTLDQRKELSKAYSQVLGIQKYDDLRNELERIQDEYRSESAKPNDKQEFNNLRVSIENSNEEINSLKEHKEDLSEKIIVQKHTVDELQTQLIREGVKMTQEELNNLKKDKESLSSKMNSAEDELKELYNLIPFGLAGELVSSVLDSLKEEKEYRQNRLQLEGVEEKTENVLSDIEKAKQGLSFTIHLQTRNFYEAQIKELIMKHFYNNLDSNRFENFTTLHDFTELQETDFITLISKIKESKTSFDRSYDKYIKAKAELLTIGRKIREAERNAESDYVQDLRERKEKFEQEVEGYIREIGRLESEITRLEDEVIANKKKKEILSKKIEVSNKNKAVDDEAGRLIHIIQQFLIKFKEEKKSALEKNLKSKLDKFLHKTNLVNGVLVDIIGNGEDIDINLVNKNGTIIDKGDLSMGERQMFASALLGALVDETEINFPVFIDSPMQKFDTTHTKNILTQFYPIVSRQVVLFPLLVKELSEEEYGLITDYVSKTYLIVHQNGVSNFMEVKPEDLFLEYKNQ